METSYSVTDIVVIEELEERITLSSDAGFLDIAGRR